MKRKIRSIFLLVIMLTFLTPSLVQASSSWQKFVAPDKSFSFHYPRGWKVEVKESNIEITDPAADEQLLIVALPYEQAKTPTDSANFLIKAIKNTASPDMKAFNWESNEATKEITVTCQLTYSESGKSYRAEALVVKDDSSRQVMWFSFSGPKAGYSRSRALAILQGFVSSVAKGSASVAPDVTLPASGTIESNARAFIFVLEFSLGAPLTGGQEETILAELLKGWETRSEKELRKYDDYPKIVEAITRATDRKALEDLRQELEKTIREWLAESEQSDPAVAVVSARLKEKGKVLIPGNPPLTVMAAAAYSEMYAYSELLQKIPNALPDRVSPVVVAEIKSQLLKAWNGFTAEERGRVASTPGLWVSLRSVLQYGSPADQAEIRAELGKIAAPVERAEKPVSATPSRERRGSGQINPVEEAIKHATLLNIKQMVFRNYMYSRGFNSSVY